MTEWFGGLLRGGAQKVSDFLCIPLCEKHHTGDWGIDNGMGELKTVKDWESAYGSQVYHLVSINSEFEYDIFDEAGLPSPT